MGEGSDEATIEEELAELKGESEGSTDADLAELEAELDAEDDAGGGAGVDADGVGLDSDPSDQYADLLDDAPASGSAGGAGASASESGGGLLGGLPGGLFGGDEADPKSDAQPGDTPASTPDASAEPTSVEGLLQDDTDDATESATDDGGGIRARIGRYFSGRWFLGALVAMVLFAGVGRTFVPIVGGPVGLAAGAFLVGLVSGDRRYLETVVAGVALGALAAVAGSVTIAFATGTLLRVAAIGAGGGLVVSLVGYYFGRDLRGGLVGGGSSSDWEEDLP